MISSATQHDWEDFWYSPEQYGTWNICEFENLWNEMESIEPLTSMKQNERESKFLTNCEMAC